MKDRNPLLKNTEISSILGELWRQTDDEEKKPFIEQEEIEREKYKERMSVWREKKARDDDTQRQRDLEKTEQAIAARAQAKKLASERATSKSAPVEPDEPGFGISYESQRSQTNGENFYQRYTPVNYDRYPNQFHWPAPEASRSQYYHLQPSAPYSSSFSNHHMNDHDKHNSNSFDVFQSQQDLGFSDHDSYLDHSQQRRSMKMEERADSPYSYSAEDFDPVPIN